MYAYKDLAELAGFTARIYTLLSSLHNLPPMPDFKTPQTEEEKQYPHIALDNVAVFPPRSSERLVAPLRLNIQPGEHLMITGPVSTAPRTIKFSHIFIPIIRMVLGKPLLPEFWLGCGMETAEPSNDRNVESKVFSLFHNGPTWLSEHCVISKCGSTVMQLVPPIQVSLFYRITYPHSYPEFLASGKTDQDLMNILKVVHLAYLPDREGGWTTRKEWRDVLSGGEKQRVRLQVCHCFKFNPSHAFF